MPDETPISCIVSLDQYQEIAFETAVFPPEIGPLYCAMGALGEAGELNEVLLNYYVSEYSEDMRETEDFNNLLDAIRHAVDACKVVEKLKKAARKGKLDLPNLPPLDDATKARIKSEQGDVMWYMGGTATVSGNTLSGICQQNIQKLRERRDAGVLKSAGETVEERKAAADD